jgi:hypothetical protein
MERTLLFEDSSISTDEKVVVTPSMRQRIDEATIIPKIRAFDDVLSNAQVFQWSTRSTKLPVVEEKEEKIQTNIRQQHRQDLAASMVFSLINSGSSMDRLVLPIIFEHVEYAHNLRTTVSLEFFRKISRNITLSHAAIMLWSFTQCFEGALPVDDHEAQALVQDLRFSCIGELHRIAQTWSISLNTIQQKLEITDQVMVRFIRDATIYGLSDWIFVPIDLMKTSIGIFSSSTSPYVINIRHLINGISDEVELQALLNLEVGAPGSQLNYPIGPYFQILVNCKFPLVDIDVTDSKEQEIVLALHLALCASEILGKWSKFQQRFLPFGHFHQHASQHIEQQMLTKLMPLVLNNIYKSTTTEQARVAVMARWLERENSLDLTLVQKVVQHMATHTVVPPVAKREMELWMVMYPGVIPTTPPTSSTRLEPPPRMSKSRKPPH